MEIIKVPVAIPLVGMIFTGILISRGATFIHDFIKSIESLKSKL